MAAIGASAASAAERQISPDNANSVTARGGWVAWEQSDSRGIRWTLWRAGKVRKFPSVESVHGLGTDWHRRTEVIYGGCSKARCVVRAQRLVDGADRLLFRAPRHVLDVAERAGNVAYTSSGDDDLVGGKGAGVFLRLAGAKRFQRIAGGGPSEIEMGKGWVVVQSYDAPSNTTRISAIDFHGHRRVLAIDDESDSDCRCSTKAIFDSTPRAEGRFAYWLERTVTSPSGTTESGPFLNASRLLRADLTSKHPIVDEFVPSHQVSPYGEFAVDRGDVFYGAWDDTMGVFQVTDPAWERAPDTLPVHG